RPSSGTDLRHQVPALHHGAQSRRRPVAPGPGGETGWAAGGGGLGAGGRSPWGSGNHLSAAGAATAGRGDPSPPQALSPSDHVAKDLRLTSEGGGSPARDLRAYGRGASRPGRATVHGVPDPFGSAGGAAMST